MLVAAIEFSTSDASRAAASLALFMAAGSRIAPALLRIQQSAVQVQGNLGLAEPTLKLLENMVQVPLLDSAQTALDFEHQGFKSEVVVSNVSFKYSDSGLDIVRKISFEVREGEMLAIVGPSGSGKSTIIDLILGVLNPSIGEIMISGLRPTHAIQKWPGAVGYVPQNVNLINQSIRRNLEIGFAEGAVPQVKIENALRDAHLLKDKINLEDSVGEFGANISGGQKQRVGIARALLLNPRLLVLDEATSSLDSKTEHDISATLMDLKGRISMIVVAHRLSTVQRADRIVYLDKGEIVACGNFEELRAQVPDFNQQAELMGLNNNER
jgi:ATP-binding cassette subfamily C protein